MQMEQYRSRRDKKSYVESLSIHMTGISIPHDNLSRPQKAGKRDTRGVYHQEGGPPKKCQRRRRRVVRF